MGNIRKTRHLRPHCYRGAMFRAAQKTSGGTTARPPRSTFDAPHVYLEWTSET